MPRIDLPDIESLTPEQLEVYESILSGPRGRLIGPLRAALLSPELAKIWSAFGEQLRYNTSVPYQSKELAILVTGRHWSAQVEWWVHSEEASKTGISKDVIEAIKVGDPPPFQKSEDIAVYEFARQTLVNGRPDDQTYKKIVDLWGAKAVMELSAIVGYYTLVALTLNAHDIPLPDEVPLQLKVPSKGLFQVPEAANKKTGE